MSMSMTNGNGVTVDDSKAWCAERFEEIRQEGSLDRVVLVHYAANGTETPLNMCSSKGPATQWNAETVATTMENIANRHARGLSGMQQFALLAIYGTSTKPGAYLPFQRFGALAAGPLPGGGWASEGAHPAGIAATGQRWGELAIAQAGAQSLQLMQYAFGEIRRQADVIREKDNDARETLVVVRNLAIASANADAEKLYKLAQVRRQSLYTKAGFTLLPGLANSFSGVPLFSASDGDASLFRGMTKLIDADKLKLLSGAAEAQGPEAQALLSAVVARAAQLKKQEQDEEAELARLEREEFGESADTAVLRPREILEDAAERMDAAASDASGKPRRLNGHAKNGTNGHANGHAPSEPAAEPANGSDDAALFRRLVGSMSPDEQGFMLAAMRARGQGELADDLQRYIETKGAKP